MKLLAACLLFTSCAWMEDYTAADAARKIMPDRGGVFVSRGDGDISGSGKGYNTEEDTVGGYLEWDFLTTRVIVEGFGKFREELARMPVEDQVVPQVLESLVAFQETTSESFEELEERITDRMDEESGELKAQLVAIQEEMDAEAFIDKIWVKLGLGGAGGMGGVALLIYLLRGGKKKNGEAKPA